MITLPKTKRDPKTIEGLCKCRPICKSRRREWQGRVQLPSDELLLERKPIPECIRRRPREVYPNGPCPLLGRTKRLNIRDRYAERKPNIVCICQAPLDISVDTPYLNFATQTLAMDFGSLLGKTRCAFCDCGACCGCNDLSDDLRNAERDDLRRAHMREFDRRVRSPQESRNMYDNN